MSWLAKNPNSQRGVNECHRPSPRTTPYAMPFPSVRRYSRTGVSQSGESVNIRAGGLEITIRQTGSSPAGDLREPLFTTDAEFGYRARLAALRREIRRSNLGTRDYR